jgi:hypothetical protein
MNKVLSRQISTNPDDVEISFVVVAGQIELYKAYLRAGKRIWHAEKEINPTGLGAWTGTGPRHNILGLEGIRFWIKDNQQFILDNQSDPCRTLKRMPGFYTLLDYLLAT